MTYENHRIQAFTLIELLIALALLGTILAAVVYVNIGTVRASASLQARNELLADTQVAQNYMVSKLKQASYIFPVGANVQMTAAGGTSTKPTGGTNWVVGTDPIIAFIMPPTTVTPGGCTPATATTVANPCYAFYAYYAMKRSAYVAASSGTDDPGDDGLNDPTSWVLIEYRGYYSNIASYGGNSYSTAAIDIPTGNRGRLLLDYVQAVSIAPLPFVVANAPSLAISQAPGITNVTLNLAVQRNVAGQIIQLPGINTNTPAGRYIQTVYPRNVGQPQLNN